MEIYLIKCGIILLVGVALWKIGENIWEAGKPIYKPGDVKPENKEKTG